MIYHGNCADGFTSAWAIWDKHPDWEFVPGVHQTEPPDVTDRDVWMVDFSYKRPVVERMLQQAKSITILDHHKSAEEDLGDLLDKGIIKGEFDMERSGARITWGWFHEGVDPPELLLHVEDRDLWKFELEGTREIQAALFSFEYDFPLWDWLMRGEDLHALKTEGKAILRKQMKDIREFIEVGQRWGSIAGYRVPLLNVPYFWASEAGHILCQGQSFAACYYDKKEGREFSLRSNEQGVDVSKIAQQYGGGGHKHAAGFRKEFDWLGD